MRKTYPGSLRLSGSACDGAYSPQKLRERPRIHSPRDVLRVIAASARLQHLFCGALTGADGTLDVSVPVRRRLRTGPVEAPDRRAHRRAELGEDARREVADHAPLRPFLL